MKTTVNTNEEFKGIEIYFEGFPYGKTRAILKVNGFRWHNTKKCWYAKDTTERRKVALQVAKREEAHSLYSEPVEAEKLLPVVYTPCQVAEPVEVAEPVPEPIEAEFVEIQPEKVSSLGITIEKKEKASRKSATEKAFATLKKNAKNMDKWNGSFDGLTFGCDGFSLMVTSDTVQDAEPIEKPDFDRMVGMKKATVENCDKVYRLDFTAKDLKAGISQLKNGKRGAKVAYTFEDGGLTINASFLLEAMNATGATEVRWNTTKAPVYMESESTFYMVCPINSKADDKKGLHLIG